MEEQATLQPKKERIEYIDALRGFTMILVVFAHIETFSLFGFTDSSFIGNIFKSFRMPLFFFISGYIAYKRNFYWNTRNLSVQLRKKIKVQLLPTIIFGLLYTYCFIGKEILDFIQNNEKLGYWFTLALLEIFVIVYSLSFLCKSKDKNTEQKRITIGLMITSAVLLIIKSVLKIVPGLNNIGNILSLHYTFEYFPYFALGYISSIYKPFFEKFLDKDYVSTSAIILFCTFTYLNFCVISQNDLFGIVLGKGFKLICGFTGIIMIFNSFKKNEATFNRSTKIGCVLQYIGKRTLDIYLLHYFFLPNLLEIGNMLKDGKNAIIELALALTLSMLIIGICIIVSNFIRTSATLGKILLGAK